MRHRVFVCAVLTALIGACDDVPPTPSGPSVSFFVTSETHTTGNLGGLAGADSTCQRLATSAGYGSRQWRAYLSVEHDSANNNLPTHARDRIGSGPWYNAALALVATNLTELHARSGAATIFLDERGQMINGQWTGSPVPNQHDILTGSNGDGTVAFGLTCADWTLATPNVAARVGHSDGMGQGQITAPPANSWNAAHESQSCADTAPRGGAGRFYCFAR